MGKWLLLVITLICAWVLYDTLRLRSSLSKAPFEVIRHIWGSGTDHLSLEERDALRKRYSSTMGIGGFVAIFLAATVVFAVATIRAFIE